MKLDAQFFKPFVDGTMKTLQVSCNIEASPLKPFIKGTEAQPKFDIAGVIGVVSNNFTGIVTLCFPEKIYLYIMNNMLGEDYKEINSEVEDGAAELLNMIFGHAKVELNERGHTIQKAIPTVVRGKDIQTRQLGQNKVVVIPFKVEIGEFHIEISADF